MDLKQIRQLVKQFGTIVLIEDGQTPLVVQETKAPALTELVLTTNPWPKKPTIQNFEEPEVTVPISKRQDQVLERLNQEILALKSEIAQEEGVISNGGVVSSEEE